MKTRTLYWSPDDGSVGGGSNIWSDATPEPTPEPTPSSAQVEPPPPETPPVDPTPPAEPVETPPAEGVSTPPAPAQPPPPPQSDWTPERVAELLRAAREPQTPEPPPQMSEEEVGRLLNRAQVTADDAEAIRDGGEGAVAALGRIVQAAVLEARTTAWYQTKMLLQQHQDNLAPVIDHFRKAEQEQLRNQFFTEHKEFTPEKHTKLLAAVKASLDAERAFVNKSRSEAFKLIADRAKELLTVSGTPLVPVGAAPQNGAPPKMAQLSRGAGHGAAAASAAPGASSNTAKRIYGS